MAHNTISSPRLGAGKLKAHDLQIIVLQLSVLDLKHENVVSDSLATITA